MALAERVQQCISASSLQAKLSPQVGASVGLIGPATLRLFSLGQGIEATAPVEIGSLTKIFTSLLLAESVRRQELQLETPVDELLFGETWGGDPAISALQLATHTSGLPRLSVPAAAILLHPRDPYIRYGRDHLLKYLRKHRPRAPARPVFSYSNFGYAVLGLMLEKATAHSYEDLLRQRLLLPLQMQATSLQLKGTPDRPSAGYSSNGKPASLWHMDGYAPCGAMVSTIEDLTRAAQAFLDPSSAVAATLALTLEPRASALGGSIGLAWILPPGGDGYWHNGGTAGYTSYLGVYKPGEAAVVIVANQALAKEATELGHQLLRLLAQPQEGHSQ